MFTLTALLQLGEIDSVTVVAKAIVAPTGVSATGGVNGVTVTADANTSVTGVEGTASVGAVTTTADANVNVTGVAGTAAIGAVIANSLPQMSLSQASQQQAELVRLPIRVMQTCTPLAFLPQAK
jgi:hypothetical protein